MAKKQKYRLFAMAVTEANVERAAAERFCRICPGYILIYLSGKRRIEGAAEVAGEDLKRLTDADRAWLRESNLAILAEAAEKAGMTARETEKRWNATLDLLEAELRAERKRAEEGAADHGPES